MYSTLLPSTRQPLPPMRESGLSETEKLQRSTDMTFGLIVVIFNILEIILIARIKTPKRKYYETVLLSLSVADLLFGLSNAAVCVIYLIDPQMESALEVTYTTYFYFVFTSILHLIFIGVDRVVAVVKPIKHNIFMTHKRLYKILAVIWFVSTFTAVALYVTNEKTDTFKKRENIFEENNTSSLNLFGEFSNSTQNTTVHNTEGHQEPCIMTNNNSNPVWEQKRIKQFHNPLIETVGEPPTPPIDKHHNNTNSTAAGCRPPLRVYPPPIKRIEMEETFKGTMELLLSYVIIAADFVLVLIYAFIIYRMQLRKDSTQSREQNKPVSLVCIFVAGVFVVFTLPYAFKNLVMGHTDFWVNILLVSNSAFNCVVYFFRGYCKNRKSRKKAKYVNNSSSAWTPPTTPLSSQRNLFVNYSTATSILIGSVNTETVKRSLSQNLTVMNSPNL